MNIAPVSKLEIHKFDGTNSCGYYYHCLPYNKPLNYDAVKYQIP